MFELTHGPNEPENPRIKEAEAVETTRLLHLDSRKDRRVPYVTLVGDLVLVKGTSIWCTLLSGGSTQPQP